MFSKFRSMLTRRAVRRRCDAPLERCAACGRDAVHPVWWEPLDEEHWWIELRCGACSRRGTHAVTNAAATRFDEDLDRARDEIKREADDLHLEIMTTQAEVFAHALEHDLIGVDDFARGGRPG